MHFCKSTYTYAANHKMFNENNHVVLCCCCRCRRLCYGCCWSSLFLLLLSSHGDRNIFPTSRSHSSAHASIYHSRDQTAADSEERFFDNIFFMPKMYTMISKKDITTLFLSSLANLRFACWRFWICFWSIGDFEYEISLLIIYKTLCIFKSVTNNSRSYVNEMYIQNECVWYENMRVYLFSFSFTWNMRAHVKCIVWKIILRFGCIGVLHTHTYAILTASFNSFSFFIRWNCDSVTLTTAISNAFILTIFQEDTYESRTKINTTGIN